MTLFSSSTLSIAVPGIAILALIAAMFVETSTWWLRALGPSQQMGLYISRSNIMAYAMRAFLIFYNALVSFFIEFGARPRSVALVLGVSFVLAGLSQIVLTSRSGLTMLVLKGMTRILLLPGPKPLLTRHKRVYDRRLFLLVVFATVIFSMGMTLPLLVAVMVPSFRLSISYLGQIINIVGMIVVLFYIDQQLFRAMVAGTLIDDVVDFTYGRMTAFLLTGAGFLAATTIQAVVYSQPITPATSAVRGHGVPQRPVPISPAVRRI